MNITYYIRNDNKEYNELCSSATIELTKDNKTYYAGSQWGHHTPSNCINFVNTNCDQLPLQGWINSLGYEVVITEID
jgi:hypothetical protein